MMAYRAFSGLEQVFHPNTSTMVWIIVVKCPIMQFSYLSDNEIKISILNVNI